MVARERIRDRLWPGTFVSESTLATVVADVRAALDEDPKRPRFLRTVHGVGFAFCGQHEHAHDIAEQALRLLLVPSQVHWGYQVGIRFLLGDYEGCVEAANRADTIISNLPGWNASALFHLGRHNEAVTEAQRFIELIRRRWLGSEPPTDEAILGWFLHLFPIKNKEDWERLRAGLAGLGLSVGHFIHHAW